MIPFYRPFFDRSELIAALRPGAGRAQFEAAVAKRLNARYGVAFAYGRSAMFAILKALEINQAEVILPAYTCLVMAQSVVASGNTPVFVDIDLADFNMQPGAIQKALTPRTRVIVATHLYGYPTDVAAIRSLAGEEVLVVEDRAQGLVSSPGSAPGPSGDIVLCSFGTNKQLSTIQGGVVLTNSPGFYEKIAAYRDRAMNVSSFRARIKRWARLIANYVVFEEPVYSSLQRAGLTGWKGGGEEGFDPPASDLPGDYGAPFMDFQGRIGLAQLIKLDTVVARRCALAALYDRELRGVPGLSPAPVVPGATYAYYSVRVGRRDELSFPQRMQRQGVAVDQAYDYALPFLNPYRAYAAGEYPCAEQAAREVVNLPIYPDLSTASVYRVAELTRRVLQEGRRTR